MYNDIHAAYQNALRWRISGQKAHGDAARDILNAWSATLTKVDGNADRFIAAGVYCYQFANAAELMRGYPGFGLERFKTMMLRVFYPMCDGFLRKHNDALVTNYWASWDLLSMCGVLAIGILCDDRAKVEQAVEYFKHGAGNGSIEQAIPYVQPGGLAQFQESGRDQGHTTLSVGLMGALCEMAWNQGIDLYGYDDHRFLKGAEYVAKYNLGKNVPFTRFTWNYGQPGVWSGSKTFTTVSAGSRGVERPVWAMIVNHYVNRRRLPAPYCTAMAERLAPEGGGGDYGPDSGGFDQLGFGTLTFTRCPRSTTSPPRKAWPEHDARTPWQVTIRQPTGPVRARVQIGNVVRRLAFRRTLHDLTVLRHVRASVPAADDPRDAQFSVKAGFLLERTPHFVRAVPRRRGKGPSSRRNNFPDAPSPRR
ncbi:alginate lyase family protein [Streptomyces sp. NPDC101234]|uniref:alginate lyase family protein n=1 Tax=Streptomyces sp. NPDC101234 TaxID=3366138 RepID=UPI003809D247